jgi:hypothetical protein
LNKNRDSLQKLLSFKILDWNIDTSPTINMELVGNTTGVEFKEETDYTSSFENFGAAKNIEQKVDDDLARVTLNPTVYMTFIAVNIYMMKHIKLYKVINDHDKCYRKWISSVHAFLVASSLF